MHTSKVIHFCFKKQKGSMWTFLTHQLVTVSKVLYESSTLQALTLKFTFRCLCKSNFNRTIFPLPCWQHKGSIIVPADKIKRSSSWNQYLSTHTIPERRGCDKSGSIDERWLALVKIFINFLSWIDWNEAEYVHTVIISTMIRIVIDILREQSMSSVFGSFNLNLI